MAGYEAGARGNERIYTGRCKVGLKKKEEGLKEERAREDNNILMQFELMGAKHLQRQGNTSTSGVHQNRRDHKICVPGTMHGAIF